MKTMRMKVKDGHLVTVDPVDLPEGEIMTYFVSEERPPILGMTEEEQGDSPEEIERWCADLDAAPALVMTPEEETDWLAWRAKMKEYNLEAVRRQMEEGFFK